MSGPILEGQHGLHRDLARTSTKRQTYGNDPSLRKETIRFLFLEGPWQISRTPMSDLILGEALLSARHLVEIATLLFLQTAKREKFYPGRQLIGGLFSSHSSLIADRSCRRSDSYNPAIVHWMTIIILNMATAQCISIVSQAGKRNHLLFFGAHGAPTSDISCRLWG
jgi:hypothetical protein